MRAFSRIPNNATGSAGQGPVPGGSNRSTQATYFDSKGVLRVAQPYELRPNYVYQNGIWVQQGFLREGQATNLAYGTPHSNHSGLTVSPTQDPRFPGQDIYLCTATVINNLAWRFTTSCTSSGSGVVSSAFLKILSMGSGSTPVTMWITSLFGVNPTFVVNKGGSIVSTDASTVIDEGGGWYRVSATTSNSDTTGLKVGASQSVTGLTFLVAYPQCEVGSGSPSSPIPLTATQNTRASD